MTKDLNDYVCSIKNVNLIRLESTFFDGPFSLLRDGSHEDSAKTGVWRMRWNQWVDLASQILDVEIARIAREADDASE